MDTVQNIEYSRSKNNDILERVVSKFIQSEINKKPLKEYQMFEGLKKPKKKSKRKKNK